MRVGIYIPSYPPEAGGGSTFERDVLGALLEISSESHHRFTVLSPGPPPDLLESLASSSNIRFYDIYDGLSIPVRLYRRVMRRWDSQGKYLSHLNYAAETLKIECIWFMTPVFQSVNIPYITMVWDLQHRLQPWFPEVGTHREWQTRERIYSELIQRASYIITGTKAGHDEISLFYQIPRGRIRILPLPTPALAEQIHDEQLQSVLKKYQLSSGFLFYPAQFWPHKNHTNLVGALKILTEKHNIHMDVVLVGSEKQNRTYIEELANELGIEKQVHFLGFVTREELIALYRSAFALTFVSYFGPDNLPPLEAFRLGCPVIASAVSGAEEQLGDAALLVNPSDPEAIADAVKSLMENPDRRNRLIELGYERASRWTAKDLVRGVFAILDEFEPVRRSWK